MPQFINIFELARRGETIEGEGASLMGHGRR